MIRNIIGFAGRKRSGKGVLTEAVQSHLGYENTEVVTIASFIKELCCRLIGLSSIEKLNAIKDNGTIINAHMDGRWVNILLEATHIPRHILEAEITRKSVIYDVRELLQYIGTDIIRKYIPDWHVNQMKKKILTIPAETTIVVDDVRFPNELKALMDMGATIYFIVRPSCMEISNHSSETALNWTKFDPEKIIFNVFPLEDFQQRFINYHFNGNKNVQQVLTAAETNPLLRGESKFGLKPTKEFRVIIDDIISQNTLRGPQTDGRLYYNPSDKKLRTQFICYIVNDKSDGRVLEIVNPLIIENLKQYI